MKITAQELLEVLRGLPHPNAIDAPYFRVCVPRTLELLPPHSRQPPALAMEERRIVEFTKAPRGKGNARWFVWELDV